jgi:5-methylthioadenosine/S-adenosylhomocysteine deaminase
MTFSVRLSLRRAGCPRLVALSGLPTLVAAAVVGLALLLAPGSVARAATESGPLAADLVITNAHVVTMNDRREVHTPGAVVIQGSASSPSAPPNSPTRYTRPEGHRRPRRSRAPGMINTHTHASMTVFRGLGDDVPDRLRRFIFPLEKNPRRPRARLLGRAARSHRDDRGRRHDVRRHVLLRGGGRARGEAGRHARPSSARPWSTFPRPTPPRPTAASNAPASSSPTIRGDPLITPAFAPHAPYTVDADHLREIAPLRRTRCCPC